ncbi:helix-turn-helix motif [Thermobifida fusca YX]|uniref:Helix-turn-helix motif n=2 Tax=Thermobifida fusca TaxID=2021 RepID=Q47S23_THEFY|nr:helix-turn-helix motif [Thermobifida fusca YX]
MTVRRPTVAGRDLGSELREIREERGLSMREVARRLDWPASKLSKIETGKQGTKREDVASLLAIYGITGQRRDYLVNKAGKVDKPGHWEKSGLDGGLSRKPEPSYVWNETQSRSRASSRCSYQACSSSPSTPAPL